MRMIIVCNRDSPCPNDTETHAHLSKIIPVSSIPLWFYRFASNQQFTRIVSMSVVMRINGGKCNCLWCQDPFSLRTCICFTVCLPWCFHPDFLTVSQNLISALFFFLFSDLCSPWICSSTWLNDLKYNIWVSLSGQYLDYPPLSTARRLRICIPTVSLWIRQGPQKETDVAHMLE